ncbi:hypothetical protein EDL96_12830 [Kocuria soli]|uniref:DUF4913 domain-containing protein n=1 Tax=Kocuria soli TaxID=2485125 RepID=A0A3N3ZNT3_9MICC|nr:hypothetical protein [Kocuria soli]ROZ61635.1 hypothetical protein EDL96_12830 [Kocuria soli]
MSEDTRTSDPTEATPAVSAWDTLVPPAADDVTEAEQKLYQDPTVEAAAAELDDVPEWLGTRWRELPQESMPEVWRWLRGWVDWLVEAHSIPASEIPPCWYRHQDIVEELWAAANAEEQAWEATTPTMTPMTAWHFHLRMMRDRLNGKAKECVGNREHVPAHSFRPGWGASVLAVDEGDWAAHLSEITDAQPAPAQDGQPMLLWRMCATDSEGEVITSDAIDVGPVTQQGNISISAPVRRGMDTEGGVLLGATVSPGAAAIGRTWWESSADGGMNWDRAVTSEVDRSVAEEEDGDEQESSEDGEDEQA